MTRRERDLRDLLDRHRDGKAKGWRLDGMTGGKHYRLVHESGAHASAALTTRNTRNLKTLLCSLPRIAEGRTGRRRETAG